jgi:hypothetical protein
MRRRAVLPCGVLCTLALSASPASASFGLHETEVSFSADGEGTPATEAATHPFAFTTTLEVNQVGEDPDGGAVKDLIVDVPPGLIVNPEAVPFCSAADFATIDNTGNACPNASAIGVIGARGDPNTTKLTDFGAVYNLRPPPGVAARFGFRVLKVQLSVEGGVRPDGEFNPFAQVLNIPQVEPFFGSVLTLWGNPADPAHDSERGRCLISKGTCPVDAAEEAFLTLPGRCTGPLQSSFKADSWQNPGAFFEEAVTSEETTDCGKVGFAPEFSTAPTNPSAESPTGLDVDVGFKDEGLINPKGTAQSEIKKTVVTLPEGMTINPSQAEGLGICTEAQFHAERADSEPGEGCPQSSKVGTIEATTPLLDEPLGGAVYVAEPYHNPFDSLLAIYLVIRNRERGVVVRLPGKVEPDPLTGQLVATVDGVPQQPISHFHFHFREGGRSPLVTPPLCGNYTTTALFTPWANPDSPAPREATFKTTHGVGGGPCPPGGTPPFDPGFLAGAINNAAGAYSPYYLRLTRPDGNQDLTKFSTTLPKGSVAKLAGVGRCTDAEIAAAKAKSGLEEKASPSCPQGSEIGRVLAGAGVGADLTYVPGHLYLAGPFNGAPLSVVAIVPAVAGPFDVGTVITRVALSLDPETGVAQVDGSRSDPIPHILAGIPLRVRDIRVYADRPDFTLNPTGCREKSFAAELWGGGTDVFSAADDSPVSRTARFQAANCANLKFKPGLSLKLKGGTKRGAHPALEATVTYPHKGRYSNISKAVVTLPHSEFLEQAHIRTVCTRVQFAAHQCPAGSIYGKAKATTPLLDEPLEGPVYLRSSNHPLPDLVIALHGLLDVNLVGRIDSTAARIRTTFASVPDAPVSKFTLKMQGAKKGLLVNSRNLCAAPARAIADLTAQNGKTLQLSPLVKAVGCG